MSYKKNIYVRCLFLLNESFIDFASFALFNYKYTYQLRKKFMVEELLSFLSSFKLFLNAFKFSKLETLILTVNGH